MVCSSQFNVRRRGDCDGLLLAMRARELVLVLVAMVTSARCEDDNKPYKFGFNIEKYQHRLEEKDTKGLVKGEFGFVTGDGVYHETAYATDENGDFKILGMRNYFVGLPGQDLPDITRGAEARATPSTSTTTAAPATARPVADVILSGIMGCSGCIIPTAGPSSASSAPSGQAGPNGLLGSVANTAGATGFAAPESGQVLTQPSAVDNAEIVENRFGAGGGDREQPTATASRPSPTATDDTQPNIKVGGLTQDEMLALLYRFNYTLGFHGHHEEGDRAGNKRGDYHFDGRDGLERRIEYTANEFGFQPNISLRELAADETPRQDAQVDERDGLRGFEFVWFGEPKGVLDQDADEQPGAARTARQRRR